MSASEQAAVENLGPNWGAYLMSLPPALPRRSSFPALEHMGGLGLMDASSACSPIRVHATPQHGPAEPSLSLQPSWATAPIQKTKT